MSTDRWWRATPIAIASTPTALFRERAPPVFLHPRHWTEGCWTCSPQWPARQQLLDQETPRKAKEAMRKSYCGRWFCRICWRRRLLALRERQVQRRT